MIYNHRAHNADNEIICTTGLVRVYQGDHVTIWEKSDESKIELIELDSSGKRTDVIIYVEGDDFWHRTPAQNVDSTLLQLQNEDSSKRYAVRYGANISDTQLDNQCVITTANVSEIEMLKPFPSTPQNYATNLSNTLKKVKLPDGMTEIGRSTFDNCKNLDHIYMTDSIQTIGENAFFECKKLLSVHMPASLRSIGYGAFWGCGIQDDVAIPQTVQGIAEKAFYESGIKSITFNSGLYAIPGNCCYKCLSLESVTIPNGVAVIAENAFGYCSELHEIEIPSSIVYISNAFANSGITKIIVHKSQGSISGAPWGATGAEVIWTG